METKMTTDHQEIIAWVNKHGAQPARALHGDINNPTSLLHIDFPDSVDVDLQPLEWDEFFKLFDEHKLALVYQDYESRFCKFVSRDEEHPAAAAGVESAGRVATRSARRRRPLEAPKSAPFTQRAKSRHQKK